MLGDGGQAKAVKALAISRATAKRERNNRKASTRIIHLAFPEGVSIFGHLRVYDVPITIRLVAFFFHGNSMKPTGSAAVRGLNVRNWPPAYLKRYTALLRENG